MRFRDRIAVILGGNSGIGRSAAEGFAREGAQVVVTGRDADTLRDTERTIGPACLAIQADITDLAATDRLMATVAERYGRIDVLFVNAGTGAFVPVADVTESFYDQVMAINLKGPYFAVQKSLYLLSTGASVVLTSSLGHCKGIAGNSVYAASKAGMRALARNFGVELVGRGVRVNCFSPGPIDTPLTTRGDLDETTLAAMRAMIRDAVPMKRFGNAEEAAAAVLFLASDDSSFVTGIDLIADGGLVSF